MSRQVRSVVVLLLAVLSRPLLAVEPPLSSRDAPLPKWSNLERAANDQLRARPGFQATDLLARSEARAVIAKLNTLGWQPADAEKLLGLVPDDDEFMVRRLRGKDKDGQRFMRQIAKLPLGYDRLDHFLRIPRGETMTADLIHNPGGYQLFEYMATAQGGKEMGKMLDRVPNGKDFNDPTGRIYTADQLLSRLKASYGQAQQERESAKSPK